MGRIIVTLLLFTPFFLLAQYPSTGNKQRLGWQTTGDGLIWRGVAADTVNKPNDRNYPYFQLDTVNAVLYRFIQTKQQWQPVTGGADVDSLIYATRYWVNSNFFPLPGGTITGTGGSGFVGFPAQSVPPATPSSGFNLYSNSNNQLSWLPPDGFFRTLISPTPLVPRQYTFMNRSYTLADSADVAALPTGSGTTNYYAKWSSGTALGVGNLFDNNTYVGILNSKPFSLGQWTTAGRPTGVQGYMGYNTTLNGLDWYNGTRWATGLESTFARGTAARVPYFDANGQITDNSGLTFAASSGITISSTGQDVFSGTSTSASSTAMIIQNTSSGTKKWAFALAGSGNAAPHGSFVFYNYENNLSLWGLYAVTKKVILNQDAGITWATGSSVSLTGDDVGISRATGGVLRMNNGSSLSTTSTSAFGLAYGTTAQTPTEFNGQIRMNSDTNTVQIYTGGARAYLATRAYARSLVSALPTTNIYTANGTLSGNRTITGGDYNIDLDNISGFNLISGARTGATSITSDVYSSLKQYVNLAKSKYVQKYNSFDSRTLTVSSQPNFVDIFEWDISGVIKYEWGNATILDTTNSIFTYKYGGRYYDAFHTFNALRPTSGTVNRLVPTYDFNVSQVGNASNWSPHTTFRNATDTLFQIKSNGVIEAKGYGVGTKEAADLSKTQSNYISGFATDGTVLDLERKRDTTIYVTDADYNFAAALTSAQILARYNNIIIYSKLTASATSDNQIILHSASSDFLQCTIQIYSNDASADADATSIDFTTNGAVDGAGGTVSTYGMVGGEKITIRAVNDSGYKWIFN